MTTKTYRPWWYQKTFWGMLLSLVLLSATVLTLVLRKDAPAECIVSGSKVVYVQPAPTFTPCGHQCDIAILPTPKPKHHRVDRSVRAIQACDLYK